MTEHDERSLGEVIADKVKYDVRRNLLTDQVTGDPTKDKLVDAARHAREGSRLPARQPPKASPAE